MITDAGVDKVIAYFGDKNKVDPSLHSYFTPQSIFMVIGGLVLRQTHYHYYVKLLINDGFCVDLRAHEIVEYIVYRIIMEGSQSGVQRLRRFIGEQNRWNNAETRKACISGIKKGLLKIVNNEYPSEINPWTLSSLDDICKLWDNADEVFWQTVAIFSSYKGDHKLWEFFDGKARTHTLECLNRKLTDQNKLLCCQYMARSTNSRFFVDKCLVGENPSCLLPEAPNETICGLYVISASSGRLKNCKSILEYYKESITQVVHQKAMFSAIINGQRNITTFYCSDESPIEESDFNDFFGTFKWVSLLYHRSAITYDFNKISERAPDLESLHTVLSHDFFKPPHSFFFADFDIDEFLQHSSWEENQETSLSILSNLCKHQKYNIVKNILSMYNFEESVYVTLLEDIGKGPGVSILYDFIMKHLKEPAEPGPELEHVLFDAVNRRDDKLFFRYSYKASKEVVESLLKRSLFGEGSIYRTAISSH
jgi:hypothetical protein